MKEKQLNTPGKRFAYARDKKGISQPKLSDQIGVSQQAIQKFEVDRTLKPSWLYEACLIIEADYDWILYGQEGKPPPGKKKDEDWENRQIDMIKGFHESERERFDNAMKLFFPEKKPR